MRTLWRLTTLSGSLAACVFVFGLTMSSIPNVAGCALGFVAMLAIMFGWTHFTLWEDRR